MEPLAYKNARLCPLPLLDAVSENQDFQASGQPAAFDPIRVAPICPEGLSVEPAILLEAAHEIPPIVPNPLQQLSGGVPGVEAHILWATAEAITGVTEQLQGVLRRAPSAPESQAQGDSQPPIGPHEQHQGEAPYTALRSWLEKTHARPYMALAKGFGITVSSRMR
jgi:hypothetical protein